MKNNIVKRLAQKMKDKFNLNKKVTLESNVCIKVFNVEDNPIVPSNRCKNNNRKLNAVNFFDASQLLQMNECQRKRYIFENTNKILAGENIFSE